MSIFQTIDHVAQALARLPQQYKGSTKLNGLITAIVTPIQLSEDQLWNLQTARMVISSASGVQLDGLGKILGRDRSGLADSSYQIILIAKVAQNVSRGTAEDVMTVYRLIMQAAWTECWDLYPASIRLYAIGTNMIGSLTDMKAAVNATRSAGVLIDQFIATTGSSAFGFASDNLAGSFGDANNPSAGGYFMGII